MLFKKRLTRKQKKRLLRKRMKRLQIIMQAVRHAHRLSTRIQDESFEKKIEHNRKALSKRVKKIRGRVISSRKRARSLWVKKF